MAATIRQPPQYNNKLNLADGQTAAVLMQGHSKALELDRALKLSPCHPQCRLNQKPGGNNRQC
jgi:hypothetical protein